MTGWLSRTYWFLRGRRQVRLQLLEDRGAIDGILMGVIRGHYVLRNSFFIAHVEKPVPEVMEGETWILKERVLLLNVKIT